LKEFLAKPHTTNSSFGAGSQQLNSRQVTAQDSRLPPNKNNKRTGWTKSPCVPVGSRLKWLHLRLQ